MMMSHLVASSAVNRKLVVNILSRFRIIQVLLFLRDRAAGLLSIRLFWLLLMVTDADVRSSLI